MIEINFNAIIDVSSIIWDENDFNANTYDYYRLISEVSTLFEETKNMGVNIIIREELLEQMIELFPFDKLPGTFYEFGNIVYTSLTNVGSKFITYSDSTLGGLSSIPNLVKPYYNEITKSEIGYLISKIHSDNETSSVYFTFKYLWNKNDKLKTETEEKTNTYETIIADNKTETEEKTNTYETIIADNGTDLNIFFAKFKPVFEHNPKHDKKPNNTREKWEKFVDKDAFDSRLSCYNGIDNFEPQKILDKKYPYKLGEEYIGYDDINEVWVRFKCHKDNLHHGFDEYDENNIEKIPLKVRRHFNK